MALGHALGHNSPKITIDPSATGSVVRTLFAAESIANILIAGWLLFYPSHALSHLVSSPSQITATACTLTQFVGLHVLIITPPLLLGLPQTQRAIESRATAWTMYAAAEVAIIGFLLYLASLGEQRTGVKPEVLRWLGQQIVPPMIGRMVTLIGNRSGLGGIGLLRRGRASSGGCGKRIKMAL